MNGLKRPSSARPESLSLSAFVKTTADRVGIAIGIEVSAGNDEYGYEYD